MKRLSAGLAALTATAFMSSVHACLVEPPPVEPPWTVWRVTKSDSPLGPDYVRQSLYMNIGIFDTAGNQMNCACGIGITGIADWVAMGLVQGLSNGFKVVEWEGDCDTGSPGNPVPPFLGLGLSAPASAAFSGWYNDASVSWFGFTGVVPPNTPDPDKKYAVCFDFDVHVSIDDLFKDGRKGILAAGVADANLMPDFGDPNHPVVVINSAPIPAPGALALLALCGLTTARKRRR